MSAKKRRTTRKNNLGLLLIGAGLVVFALVATLILMNQDAAAGGRDEYSVTPARVDFPAPDLVLSDLDGQEVSLKDFHGSVVLINNWATWCPPCRAEMPVLNAYHQQHAAEGFSIIAVDAGEPAADVRRFAESMELSFPVWLDPQMKTIQAFRNQGLPSSYVVDRDGTVVLAWNGAVSQEVLEKYVTPLLEN